MKLGWLLLCIVMLLMPVGVFAQQHAVSDLPVQESSHQHKVVVIGDAFERYISTTNVGDVTERESRYFLQAPNRDILIAFEAQNNVVKVPVEAGLELQLTGVSLGVSPPLKEWWGKPLALKLAGERSAYQRKRGEPVNDFWAFGVYPKYVPSDTRTFNLDLEHDSERTWQFDGYAGFGNTNRLYLGAGRSEYVKQGSKRLMSARRVGSAARVAFGTNNLAFGGVTYTFDTERPTWSLGLAHCVNHGGPSGSGANPAFIAIGRIKPEAKFGLGIVTLWGQALGKGMVGGLMESFVPGSFVQTQVVNNKTFDTPGQSNAYDAQDFGRIAATVTIVDVKAGATTRMRQAEYTLYGTLPHSGVITNPYAGLSYDESTDLLFSPRLRRMTDPGHVWTTVKAGAKLQIVSRPDPRRLARSGYLRIELNTRIHGHIQGAGIEATYWI
ncbi:MAG: hypothetical protein WC734_01520 [Patescibacteria group bacterium]|jgi:hypothetical protein